MDPFEFDINVLGNGSAAGEFDRVVHETRFKDLYFHRRRRSVFERQCVSAVVVAFRGRFFTAAAEPNFRIWHWLAFEKNLAANACRIRPARRYQQA